jgi:hypothetical protein
MSDENTGTGVVTPFGASGMDSDGTMLRSDIPLEHIRWKISASTKDKTKSLYVPYADARAVAEALDRARGWSGWSDEYRIEEHDAKVWVICTITVWTPERAVSKTDMAEATDFEAVKGGASDAFKRAAVKFGIGRNLYALPSVWAPSEVINGQARPPRNIEAVLWRKVAELGHEVPEPSNPDVVEVEEEVPTSTAEPFLQPTADARATSWAKLQFVELLGGDVDLAKDEWVRRTTAHRLNPEAVTREWASELVAELGTALASQPPPEGAPF